jgi:thioredoxin-related protein
MRNAFRISLFALLMLAPAAASRAGLDTELPPPPGTSLELIVVEAEGCVYCELFRRDVLPAYETSEKGKGLPVRFVDINDIDADHLDFKSDVEIVPTFVIVKSSHELGRISGYIAPEDFFHSIDYLLASAP